MTPTLSMIRTHDNIIVILQQTPCPTTNHIGATGCDRTTHTYQTIINLGVLKPEETWCLDQCLIPHKVKT